MKKAVFLDRDGVINKIFMKDGLPISPPTFEELEILPKVKDSISILRELNFLSLVVTNQPDISRKKISLKTVEKINNFIQNETKFDDLFVCYHDDHDNCLCRKPKPGLILNAAEKWNVDLKKSFMIGDRWKDIEAGKSAGCKTILIKSNYAENIKSKPDFEVDSLYSATNLIKKIND